eukprot:5724559-Amphidinium_carterae.2
MKICKIQTSSDPQLCRKTSEKAGHQGPAMYMYILYVHTLAFVAITSGMWGGLSSSEFTHRIPFGTIPNTKLLLNKLPRCVSSVTCYSQRFWLPTGCFYWLLFLPFSHARCMSAH